MQMWFSIKTRLQPMISTKGMDGNGCEFNSLPLSTCSQIDSFRFTVSPLIYVMNRVG